MLTHRTWIAEGAAMSTKLQQNSYDQFAHEYARSFVQPRTDGFHFILDLIIPLKYAQEASDATTR
jgi:hypothetical protein